MSTNTIGYLRKENFLEKLVLKPWFWLILVSFGLLFPIVKSVLRPLPPDQPVYYKVPDYSLTNRFGQPFGSTNLKGKVYMATFMFTSCPSTCTTLMKKVQIIQKRVRGLGNKVGIVSISVDSENDTPAVLNKYATKLRANPRVWSFLTGDSKKIKDLLNNGFKVAVGDKNLIGTTDVFSIESKAFLKSSLRIN